MHTVRDLLLPLASAVMIACITISLVAVSYTFGSNWNAGYLVPLSALVAIESYFSVRIAAGLRLRIVELAIIYAVLEAADALANGGTLRQSLTPRISESLLLGGILLLVVWLGVREMAELAGEIVDSNEPSNVVGALALRFAAGGVFLFVVAGLSQRSVTTDLRLTSSAASGPLLNVLVYFLVGMLVLSYMRYQSMQRRWEIQKIRVTNNLQASWLWLTAGLLVLALLLALVLPTSEVFGLSALIGAIGKALGGLGFLNHLLGHGSAPQIGKVFGHGRHPVPTPSPEAPGNRHPSSLPAWLGVARTAIFWALIAGGIVVMLVRLNWAALRRERLSGHRPSLLTRLARLFRRLWHRVRRSAGAIAALVPRALPRPVTASPPGGLRRFLRVNALSPEQQVRYFYLSLIRRAHDRGIDRPPSQTPREFAAHLSPSVGNAEQDLDALTDAFIEARYSGHPIENERVPPIKTHWQRVRNALRAGPPLPRG